MNNFYPVLPLKELIEKQPQNLASICGTVASVKAFINVMRDAHFYRVEHTSKDQVAKNVMANPAAVPIFSFDDDIPGIPEMCIIGADTNGEIIGIWQVPSVVFDPQETLPN